MRSVVRSGHPPRCPLGPMSISPYFEDYPPPSRMVPPPVPPPDSQNHHSFSSIFKWYLFRGKPRENQHHMRWVTATGGGGGIMRTR